MTTPTIPATVQGNDAVNTTSHVLTLPLSLVVGEDVYAELAMDGNTTLTWPAGWDVVSPITNSGGDGTLEVRRHRVDGSEGLTITVTSGASEGGAWILWRVANQHPTQAPAAGTPATGSGLNPDPPSVTAPWGAHGDTLAIEVLALGTSVSSITAYSSNYTDNQIQDAASNGNIAGVAVATRNLANNTDDPGTMTISNTTNWVANTILIRGTGKSMVYNPHRRDKAGLLPR